MELVGRQHREFPPREDRHRPPETVQGVIQVAVLVGSLGQAGVEGLGEGEVATFGLRQRLGAQQVGELGDVAGTRQQRQRRGAEVEVVVARAAGAAPRRISRDREESGSIGG